VICHHSVNAYQNTLKKGGNKLDVHMHCKNIYLSVQPSELQILLPELAAQARQEAKLRLEARLNKFKIFSERQHAVSINVEEEKSC